MATCYYCGQHLTVVEFCEVCGRVVCPDHVCEPGGKTTGCNGSSTPKVKKNGGRRRKERHSNSYPSEVVTLALEKENDKRYHRPKYRKTYP